MFELKTVFHVNICYENGDRAAIRLRHCVCVKRDCGVGNKSPLKRPCKQLNPEKEDRAAPTQM